MTTCSLLREGICPVVCGGSTTMGLIVLSKYSIFSIVKSVAGLNRPPATLQFASMSVIFFLYFSS